ncbi:ATP-binding protein [Roseisolibacter sp. H3M3-2]|uniref:ATP-binding protein n=1 Tax=Roseisolibacter sp. H3M3-2 TaxID=3031323 RepID=UPI0023DB640D|nr:ATP-binding protein [Roseisolibacter sp. H3M3-2]MDF1505083.1 ATP-binding protein [Roseisolibacter sp. H3M3-2]
MTARPPVPRAPRAPSRDAWWTLGAWLLAAACTAALAPLITRAVFVFFWGAVLVAAWRTGMRAAVAAAVASIVFVDLLVIPPLWRLQPPDVGTALSFTAFLTVSSALGWLASTRARAQATAEERALQLQEQAVELEVQAENAQQVAEELEHASERLQETATEAEEAREVAEASGDRARRLLAVSTRLARAATPGEVADAILEEGLAALGADAGTLALRRDGPDGPELEIARAVGYPDTMVDAYRRFPLHAGRPLSDAVLAREPRWLTSRRDWEARYPESAAATTGLPFEAFVAIPIVVDGEAAAAFSASFRTPRAFDDATRTFLATIGEQCALALGRARAFEAERGAREFAGGIVASVRDAFVGLDGDMAFTFVNARAAEMLGHPADALLGRRVVEAIPGAEHGVIFRAARRVLRTREAETLEADSPVLGGWIEARLYPAAGGLTIFFENVTERRRARQTSEFLVEATRLLGASLAYEETLRAVARAAVPRLGALCAVDVVEDPTHPVWPPRVERLAMVHEDPAQLALAERLAARYPTDWGAEVGMAAVLRDRATLFVPELTDAMLAGGARDAEHLALLRALRLGSIIVVPLVARGVTLGALTLGTADGRRRFTEADRALAEDLAGRAAVAVDNARLYREAERARAEAEAANRAKSQFLSTMSHELRTPLNAIAGYTELLALGVRGAVTDEQREDLTRIRRGATVLMSLVNDVLNFARVEAGQVEVRVEEVPLGALLAGLEAMVAPQLRAKGLEYALRLPDAPPVVRADAERLEQVLTNLLTNAVKFTDAGGRIEVSCDADGGATAAVRVRDSGRGIPADRLAHIFEPFVQVDRHLTRDSQQGVGLGLAISRELARAMGGELTVESAPGVGSTFTLVLPRAG